MPPMATIRIPAHTAEAACIIETFERGSMPPHRPRASDDRDRDRHLMPKPRSRLPMPAPRWAQQSAHDRNRDRVGAAEMQLSGMRRAILHCRYAAAERCFRVRYVDRDETGSGNACAVFGYAWHQIGAWHLTAFRRRVCNRTLEQHIRKGQ